jgi:hypothetical protein
MSSQAANEARRAEIDDIIELARGAGLLVTLDGLIGREKYQSVAGSLTALMRFAEALRANLVSSATA